MNGHRPLDDRDRSTPGDVVGWFNAWLGRRRDALRGGQSRAVPGIGRPRGDPHGAGRGSALAETRALLSRGGAAIRSEVFDRAFRSLVSGGDGGDSPAAAAVDSRAPSAPTDVRGAVPYPWQPRPLHVMRRQELCLWLERWYRESDARTIGDVGTYARRPWLKLGIGAVNCHLNANTNRAGVEAYLALVRNEGVRLPWFVVPCHTGRINQVAVGRERLRLRGFHVFTDSVFTCSGLIGGARSVAGRAAGRPRVSGSAIDWNAARMP